MAAKQIFLVVLLCGAVIMQTTFAQHLEPGFDKSEYIEMLAIAQKAHIDIDKWQTSTTVPDPQKFNFVYRSPEVGFDNLWDLWISDDEVAVISIRGSISTSVSFLANFYAAMVPAKGELQLEKSFSFKYNLSDNPESAVHVGWLISMAFLSRDILPKIDSCYKNLGIKDFIITGHSQGGGISFLLTSYLENLKREKILPGDIRFKTYCSAGPKPGNLFYAYDFENLTRGGWAFNVVNTADWVPEMPFSIQTIHDFTTVNPFTDAEIVIKQQKFPNNIAFKHVYNKLSKPAQKAQRNYQKYLGKMVSSEVRKQFPDSHSPEYYSSNYYVRTSTTIVLYANEEYFKIFPKDPTKLWQHHLIEPYLYLTQKLPELSITSSTSEIQINKASTDTFGGSEMLFMFQWNVTEIQGQPVAQTQDHIPYLLFYPGQLSRVSGSTGCNRLNGTFNLTGLNFIDFSDIATTKMTCLDNDTEINFIEALGQVNNWSILNNQLFLSNGKILVMKLHAVPVELNDLEGTWELNYISGRKISFDGLYPDKKPEISFNVAASELGGNTSCNGFGSKMIIEGNKITIDEPFAKTMIFCEGEGESAFLDMLKKVNAYSLNDNTLTFLIDDVAVMRFSRK